MWFDLSKVHVNYCYLQYMNENWEIAKGIVGDKLGYIKDNRQLSNYLYLSSEDRGIELGLLINSKL